MRQMTVLSMALLSVLANVTFSQEGRADEKTTLIQLKKIGAVVKMLSDDGESWCKDETEGIITFDDQNRFEEATADGEAYIKYVDKIVLSIGVDVFPVECPAANYLTIYYMTPREFGLFGGSFEDWVLANRRTGWKPHRCSQSIFSDACSPLERLRQEQRPW